MSENTQKKTAPKSSTAIDAEQTFVKNNTTIIPQKTEYCNDLQTISMEELFDNVYPPRACIVENLFYVGTYLFVGSPKVGKSFFMAQLGYSVGTGTDLWGYRVNQGGTLYLALEDNYSRLQQRLSTMYGTETTPNFHMAIVAKKLNEGLDKQLESYMKKYPNTKLIIIDTLKKIRDKENEQYSYSNDYDIVDNLKSFTDSYNICLLVVHHTRKQFAEDAFETISGSNGLLGAADGAFIMQKLKRVEGKATLDITGRDQADQKLHLQFDQDTFLWNMTKAENKISAPPPDEVLEKISTLLSLENPSWTGAASDLLSLLDEVDLQPNTLTRKLNVNVERLLNEYNIRYENSRTRQGSHTLGEDGMYYPDIALEEQGDYPIGKYGRMRERFLKEHRTGTYTSLLMTGKLHAHLYEIDTLVHQRVDEIVAHMAKRDGTDEGLKARDQMEWVGRMNNYRHCAKEVVFKEIIYV